MSTDGINNKGFVVMDADEDDNKRERERLLERGSLCAAREATSTTYSLWSAVLEKMP